MLASHAFTLLSLALSMSAVAADLDHQAMQQQAPALQVLKIAAGPTGKELQDGFVLTEERSTFNRSDDREVIVLFQWMGAPGPHKLLALWRSPDGGMTSSSAIDYIARDRRFGAYWRLTLTPTLPTGNWSIEVTVDGQPGGRFTFDVTDTKVQGGIVKVPLSQSQLYDRLNHMFVILQRSLTSGAQLDAAAAFSGYKGRIYTAAAAIDDADRLEAVLPDGSKHEIATLLAWNRRQDWAVVAGGADAEVLAVAAANATNVGDRCYSMEAGASGGRVLSECTITGKGGSPGPMLLATFFNGLGTPGAPVLNEYGELIGIIGAGNVPGATRLQHIMRFRAELKGAPIVPFNLVRVPEGATGSALAELRASGEIIAAVSGDEHVVSGGFARAIAKSPIVAPAEQRDEFSVHDKSFVVFVSWSPQQRLKGQMVLRLHDADNHVVVESKPKRTDLPRRDLRLSSWEIPMLATPGLYRADVLLDARTLWRGFVRITP